MSSLIILAAESEYTDALVNSCHTRGFEIARVVLQRSSEKRKNIVAKVFPELYLSVSHLVRPNLEKKVSLKEAIAKSKAKKYFKSKAGMLLPASYDRLMVDNVNDPAVHRILSGAAYDIIIVFGTSLIKAPTLRCAQSPLINFHSSLLPGYRGFFPEFWQLLSNDHENLGYTFHLIDEGVDTGSILMQRKVAYDGKNPYMLRVINVLDAIDALPELITNYLKGFVAPVPQGQSPTGRTFRYAEWTLDVRTELFMKERKHEESH